LCAKACERKRDERDRVKEGNEKKKKLFVEGEIMLCMKTKNNLTIMSYLSIFLDIFLNLIYLIGNSLTF
jgi:hypothetical protein